MKIKEKEKKKKKVPTSGPVVCAQDLCKGE